MPHIRAAWFKVLTVICQKAEILLEGKEKEVTNIVFTSLDDSDPTVLPHVWEATLMVMSTLQVMKYFSPIKFVCHTLYCNWNLDFH